MSEELAMSDDTVSNEVVEAQIEEDEAIENAQLALEIGRVFEADLEQPVDEQCHPIIVRTKNCPFKDI